MKLQANDRRVQKFLDRHLNSPAFQWDEITDPRARRGRRWALRELLNAAFAGMLTACATLREVELLTDEMGEVGRQLVSRRVPDTTLWELFCPPRAANKPNKRREPRQLLSAEEFRRQLRRQVRAMDRAKCLAPEGLPCGVISFDGKGLGALEHDAEGTAQKGHRNDGSPYWLARVLRASLTSAASKPVLDQVPIGSKSNEVASFSAFYSEVVAAYDSLFEIVTGDAGFTSKSNADEVHASNKGYVFALKENQPELLAEAGRLLLERLGQEPEAETSESYRGKTVRRRLYRTTEIAGYHDWHHLKQAWLIEQVTVSADGRTETELRFFVTNLHQGRLSKAQILTLVRGHWGIENDVFWSLDMQWKEDSVPWCSNGNAIEVLSLMRLMAYNLVQLARKRSLRPRGIHGRLAPIPSWRSVLRWVRDALRLDLQSVLCPAVG